MDHGQPDTFEVVWKNGHTERLVAHQVSWPQKLGGDFGFRPTGRIAFHAEVDGHWRASS